MRGSGEAELLGLLHILFESVLGGDAQRELVPPRLIPPDSPAPLPRLVAPGAADADGRRRWRGRVSAVAGVVGGALDRLRFLPNPHAPRRE